MNKKCLNNNHHNNSYTTNNAISSTTNNYSSNNNSNDENEDENDTECLNHHNLGNDHDDADLDDDEDINNNKIDGVRTTNSHFNHQELVSKLNKSQISRREQRQNANSRRQKSEEPVVVHPRKQTLSANSDNNTLKPVCRYMRANSAEAGVNNRQKQSQLLGGQKSPIVKKLSFNLEPQEIIPNSNELNYSDNDLSASVFSIPQKKKYCKFKDIYGKTSFFGPQRLKKIFISVL